ncbi:MAG: BamA/TamA family outer membrane protein [Woeseiaceae bacterium]|nr:BamA/TamA family outer membrane protein [Woeseiaceae bacterium]
MRRQFLILACLAGIHWPAVGASADASATVDLEGATIRNVALDKANIFDTDNPDEDKWLYRLANRFHVITRDATIRKQLLFQPGQPYSQRLVEETERILRQRKYIYDAEIRATQVEPGIVDVDVITRDIWSLVPEVSFSRGGGENKWRAGFEESNLFGRGQSLQFTYAEDKDRDSTAVSFVDEHLGRSRVALYTKLSDNSDGETQFLSVARPFYALDARWAAGGSLFADERESTLYVAGDEAAEFGHDRDYLSLFGGFSKGLRGRFARRWTYGVTYDENRFSPVADPTLPNLLPGDRQLVYPFLGFELVEDEFVTSQNKDQISRTEDFLMGRRVAASLGWSDESFGADRNALIYAASASQGFGTLGEHALLLSLQAQGRLESGDSRNAQVWLSARYYRRQSEKRLLFASVSGSTGHALDIDNPVFIGGDSGLRGYPINYQNGDSSLVATLEQRYFTDWYPWRLFRIGAAVFADVGRVWGPNPVGPERREWLSNVGIGLRIAPTRFSTRKIFHLDIAAPLNGDDSIDSVQVSFSAKRSF